MTIVYHETTVVQALGKYSLPYYLLEYLAMLTWEESWTGISCVGCSELVSDSSDRSHPCSVQCQNRNSRPWERRA